MTVPLIQLIIVGYIHGNTTHSNSFRYRPTHSQQTKLNNYMYIDMTYGTGNVVLAHNFS